jgi:hypothetical protein
MFTFTEHVDVMTTHEDSFYAVADLMMRGHYYPESVFLLRETAPRPPSPTEKFLPGQSAAYRIENTTYETTVTGVEEWHNAEARVVELLKNSPKGERLDWRLSELLQGTIRVELKFSADYGLLERVSRGNQVHKFWRTTLDRLKQYLEDKQSLAHPRMFAPKAQS